MKQARVLAREKHPRADKRWTSHVDVTLYSTSEGKLGIKRGFNSLVRARHGQERAKVRARRRAGVRYDFAHVHGDSLIFRLESR